MVGKADQILRLALQNPADAFFFIGTPATITKAGAAITVSPEQLTETLTPLARAIGGSFAIDVLLEANGPIRVMGADTARLLAYVPPHLATVHIPAANLLDELTTWAEAGGTVMLRCRSFLEPLPGAIVAASLSRDADAWTAWHALHCTSEATR